MVTGTVAGNYTTVTVNGTTIVVSATGYFQAPIALVAGQNTVTVAANGTSPCTNVTKTITIGCNPGCQKPVTTNDFTGSAVVNGNSVTFNGTYNMNSVATLSLNVNGTIYPITLNNGTWTLTVNNLTHGMNYVTTLTATAKDSMCSSMSQNISFTCGVLICGPSMQITGADYTTGVRVVGTTVYFEGSYNTGKISTITALYSGITYTAILNSNGTYSITVPNVTANISQSAVLTFT
jgi:hypothetical protein